jgi:hypothetical protein
VSWGVRQEFPKQGVTKRGRLKTPQRFGTGGQTMNKQIEEMAQFMLEKSNSANVEPIFEAKDGTQIVLGEQATKLLDDVLEQAFIPFLAKALYNAGYRKTEDVAREIFEEIVKFVFSEIPNELMPIYKAEKDFRDGVISGKREAFFKVLTHLENHLRKKYESEGVDDGNGR